MKKLLTLVFCFIASGSFAQIHLTGSAYTQNFNALSAGLPEGWQVDTNAKPASGGGSAGATFISTPAAATRWGNVSGGFKNVASANGFTSFAAGTNPLQLAATDRALGVKQTGTFGDSGASFTFIMDNTFRLSDFTMDFKLQSLDSSNGSKITTWLVQYGIGAAPRVFLTIGTGVMNTGGNTFNNIAYNIPFGTAIDNKREPVWIRIVALVKATGSGSRATTAIDDVELKWKGIPLSGDRPLVQKLFPWNMATGVPMGCILSVDFSKNISLGTSGNIFIKNETDNTLQTISAGSTFLNASGKTLSVSGVKLDISKMYHVTFDSTIVDSALASTYAITDTMEWRFSTHFSLPKFIDEDFDTVCSRHNALPFRWSKFSASGAEQWNCMEYDAGNSSMRMYGNDGTANAANEDWLISPRLDRKTSYISGIEFSLYKSFTGPELQVLVSQNYAGSGSPDSALWTPISLPMSSGTVDNWMRYDFPVSAFKGEGLYVGFKYISTAAGAYEIQVDSFMTLIETGIKNNFIAENKTLKILGYPTNNKIDLEFTTTETGNYQLELFNAFGQKVYTNELLLVGGKQNISVNNINLNAGLYVVKIANGKVQILQKCIVR